MQKHIVKNLGTGVKADASIGTAGHDRILKLARAGEDPAPVQTGIQPQTNVPAHADSVGDHDRNFKEESRRNRKIRFRISRAGL
jgi:hypothetical protein